MCTSFDGRSPRPVHSTQHVVCPAIRPDSVRTCASRNKLRKESEEKNSFLRLFRDAHVHTHLHVTSVCDTLRVVEKIFLIFINDENKKYFLRKFLRNFLHFFISWKNDEKWSFLALFEKVISGADFFWWKKIKSYYIFEPILFLIDAGNVFTEIRSDGWTHYMSWWVGNF